MATDTSIEWANKTWGPIIGCDRVSEGCRGCYAISQARIRSFNPHPGIAKAFAGTVDVIDGRVDWTGQINQLDDRLTQPLTWRKPAKVFVNSLSDLFHKNVDHDFIAKILAIMALTPQHTYQVLTKRHARMRAVLNDRCTCGNGHIDGVHLRSAMAWACSKANPDRIPGLPDDAEHRVYFETPWPLPNLHLGVSVETQEWADIRIPALLGTPAAVRWISAEPLLGPVDLTPWLGAWNLAVTHSQANPTHILGPYEDGTGASHIDCDTCWFDTTRTGLDWVVAGGESGPKARPMHPNWPRGLRKQCAEARVPFLFKQWGEWGVDWPLGDDGRIVSTRRGLGITVADDGTVYQPGDLAYPDGPRYGEALRADHGSASLTAMYRLGKKKAGRELDGRTHDAFPVVGP